MSDRVSDTPDAKIPDGPIESKWSKHKRESKLINPTGAARDFIQVSNESEEPIRWLRSSSSSANAPQLTIIMSASRRGEK